MTIEAQLRRLVQAGFEPVPMAFPKHVALARNGFVSMIERREDRLGRAGAPGIVTDRGFAPLVWRGEVAFFVVKDHELQATEQQVNGLRQFLADLEAALA